jgi:hypothetical protein
VLEGIAVLKVLKGTAVRTLSTLSALAALTISCANHPEDANIPARSIEQVLEQHNDSLTTLPGVVGTAIGRCDGAPCIRVFVADSASAQGAGIPARLEGYPVRVEVTGPVRPREPPPSSAAH